MTNLMHILFCIINCITILNCQTFYGTNNYVEYYVGSNSNILISIPHDGTLQPSTITNRTGDSNLARDLNTKQIALIIRDVLAASLGGTPHVVVNNLHRVKMDPNRESPDFCNSLSETSCVTAYNEYHQFIGTTFRNYLTTNSPLFRSALILDIHGQAHTIDWLEIGYNIAASKLNKTGTLTNPTRSTICNLASSSSYSFENLVRGAGVSLGSIITDQFTAASLPIQATVPSSYNPRPLLNPYYDGGYISETYANCLDTNAVQLEINKSLRNITDAQFTNKINALATAIKNWYNLHNLGARV